MSVRALDFSLAGLGMSQMNWTFGWTLLKEGIFLIDTKVRLSPPQAVADTNVSILGKKRQEKTAQPEENYGGSKI